MFALGGAGPGLEEGPDCHVCCDPSYHGHEPDAYECVPGLWDVHMLINPVVGGQ